MLKTQPGIAFDTKEPVATDPQQLGAAAQKGDAKAMYELGKRYENGVGVIQNYVRSHAWYNISASRGYTEAAKARDAVAKKMTAEQLAEAQKLAINWKPSKGSDSPVKAGLKGGEAKKGGEKESAKSIWDAPKNGDTVRVKELIKQGTSPNAKDQNGWFPLMYATYSGHKETVEAFLAAGADVNMKRPDGSTALMAAALGGHKSVVEVLLKKGADVNAVNTKGLTALVVTEKKGYTEIAELFKSKNPQQVYMKSSEDKPSPRNASDLSGKVVETMNGGVYTYLCIERDGEKIWAAVLEMKVTVGQEIALQPGYEMITFKSKPLNRTFDKIIFPTGPVPT